MYSAWSGYCELVAYFSVRLFNKCDWLAIPKEHVFNQTVKENRRNFLLYTVYHQFILPSSQILPHAQFTESSPISSPLFGSYYAGASKDTRPVFSEGISSDCARHRSWLRPNFSSGNFFLNIVSGKIIIFVSCAVSVCHLLTNGRMYR